MINQQRSGIIKSEELLNAALLTLLIRYDLEDIHVRDICEQAQVNRTIFYAYFQDKYDLLNHCQKTS